MKYPGTSSKGAKYVHAYAQNCDLTQAVFLPSHTVSPRNAAGQRSPEHDPRLIVFRMKFCQPDLVVWIVQFKKKGSYPETFGSISEVKAGF